jgi:hypothetical protein
MNVTVVHNGDEKLVKRIMKADLAGNPFIEFLDISIHNDKKKAYKLKSYYGARLNPFILIAGKDFELPLYSEADSDIVSTLITKLNARELN